MLLNLFLLYLLIIISLTHASNINTLNPITFSFTDTGSLFGFSVKIYTPSSNPPSILIGAPRAEGSPNVPRTGNVYSCSPNTSVCTPLLLSKLSDPNEMRQDSVEVGPYVAENKSSMWLGVSIEVSDYGPIITCGHRYVNTGANGLSANMQGICHYLPDISTNSTLHEPCSSCSLITHGNCLAGLGLNLNYDGLSPLIGTPGADQFSGKVFHGREFGTCDRTQFPASDSSFMFGMDSLFGFSIARGRVINPNYEDIISGMPRYDFLKGGFAIFRNESDMFSERIIIPGQYFGAYFAHAIAACDIDGDGLDEIIVGLPTFSTPLASEVGLVQIFFSISQTTTFTNITIENPEALEYSRFGYSIANLGDITKSGGMEFAVGAPFGSGSGKVYIFTWDSTTSAPVLFQTISGSDMNLRSFGTSISPGRDFDGNKYNDLLVGAPFSSQAFLMYSHPVIHLLSQFQFNTEHIFTRNFATCNVMIGGVESNPICFEMDFLLNYSGIDIPDSVRLNFEITLDRTFFQKSFRFRVYFVQNGVKTNTLQLTNMTLDIGILQSVISEQIYVESNPSDLLTPVQFYVEVSEYKDTTRDPNYFTDVKILGQNTFSESLQIRNINCGDDNLCKSDLEISGNLTYPYDSTINNSRKRFIANEVKQVNLTFEVRNKLEEALSPILSLFIPPALNLIRILEAEFNIHNETTFSNGSSLILINIGTSLVENESAVINIMLSVSQNVENFTIEFSIKGANFENPGLLVDNFGSFSVVVTRRAILQLQGFLETDQVYYNGTNPVQNIVSVQSLGSEVVHSYLLNNLNSSTVEHLKINFVWPLGKIATNEFLLYLTSLEYESNKNTSVQCDFSYVNYLNLSTIDLVRTNRRSTRNSNYRLFRRESTTLPTSILCDESPEWCVRFSCFVSRLPPSAGISFTMKSHVFDRTLAQLGPSPTATWELYTTVNVEVIESGVDELYFIPPEREINLLTRILSEELTITYFQLQWYHIIPIILAVIVPFVLFIIIIIILYFCGFFKIKKRGSKELHIPTEEEFEEESNDFNIVEVSGPMPL